MTHKLISFAAFKTAAKQVKYLFDNLWKERTTAILRAPLSVDKTPFVLEIIRKLVSDNQEVVYVNTGHNLDAHAERLASGPDFLIYTPAYDSPEDKRDYADLVIEDIEEIVATTSVRTFVVDSVSRIAALSFGRNASAAYVMKRLIALQVRLGLSLLVLANDTTKSVDRALTALADCEISMPDNEEAPVKEAKPSRKHVFKPAVQFFAEKESSSSSSSKSKSQPSS